MTVSLQRKFQCNIEITLISTSKSLWANVRSMQAYRQAGTHSFYMMLLGGNGIFLAHHRTATVCNPGAWLACSVAPASLEKSLCFPHTKMCKEFKRAVFHCRLVKILCKRFNCALQACPNSRTKLQLGRTDKDAL